MEIGDRHIQTDSHRRPIFNVVGLINDSLNSKYCMTTTRFCFKAKLQGIRNQIVFKS